MPSSQELQTNKIPQSFTDRCFWVTYLAVQKQRHQRVLVSSPTPGLTRSFRPPSFNGRGVVSNTTSVWTINTHQVVLSSLCLIGIYHHSGPHLPGRPLHPVSSNQFYKSSRRFSLFDEGRRRDLGQSQKKLISFFPVSSIYWKLPLRSTCLISFP